MSVRQHHVTETAPESIEYRTRRDINITIQALEQRASQLDRLSDGNKKAGYPQAAAVQAADKTAIERFILPLFREQAELALDTQEDLEHELEAELRDIISGALVVKAPADRQEDALKSREERLLEQLSKKLAPYIVAVATGAFNAGMAARRITPEGLALAELSALRGDA